MKQLEAARRYNEATRLKRGTEKYTLELTADELDWLLLEILQHAAVEAKTQENFSKELDIRQAIDQWWTQASDQGYRPF